MFFHTNQCGLGDRDPTETGCRSSPAVPFCGRTKGPGSAAQAPRGARRRRAAVFRWKKPSRSGVRLWSPVLAGVLKTAGQGRVRIRLRDLSSGLWGGDFLSPRTRCAGTGIWGKIARRSGRAPGTCCRRSAPSPAGGGPSAPVAAAGRRCNAAGRGAPGRSRPAAGWSAAAAPRPALAAPPARSWAAAAPARHWFSGHHVVGGGRGRGRGRAGGGCPGNGRVSSGGGSAERRSRAASPCPALPRARHCPPGPRYRRRGAEVCPGGLRGGTGRDVDGKEPAGSTTRGGAWGAGRGGAGQGRAASRRVSGTALLPVLPGGGDGLRSSLAPAASRCGWGGACRCAAGAGGDGAAPGRRFPAVRGCGRSWRRGAAWEVRAVALSTCCAARERSGAFPVAARLVPELCRRELAVCGRRFLLRSSAAAGRMVLLSRAAAA